MQGDDTYRFLAAKYTSENGPSETEMRGAIIEKFSNLGLMQQERDGCRMIIETANDGVHNGNERQLDRHMNWGLDVFIIGRQSTLLSIT